jgi:hypothetical protein
VGLGEGVVGHLENNRWGEKEWEGEEDGEQWRERMRVFKILSEYWMDKPRATTPRSTFLRGAGVMINYT